MSYVSYHEDDQSRHEDNEHYAKRRLKTDSNSTQYKHPKDVSNCISQIQERRFSPCKHCSTKYYGLESKIQRLEGANANLMREKAFLENSLKEMKVRLDGAIAKNDKLRTRQNSTALPPRTEYLNNYQRYNRAA